MSRTESAFLLATKTPWGIPMNSRSPIDETRPSNGSSTPSNENVGSPARRDGVHSAAAARILDDIRRAVERDPKGAQAAALRLVALLRGSGGAERVIARGGLALWQQRTLDRYLEKRLMEPMRTVDLAGQVGLSVSHFSRAFSLPTPVSSCGDWS